MQIPFNFSSRFLSLTTIIDTINQQQQQAFITLLLYSLVKFSLMLYWKATGNEVAH